MRILVFNTKGGCGKSLVAREIIAAPIAKEVVLVEIDVLNRTQQSYAEWFKEVVQLNDETTPDLIKLLNMNTHVVIDVGAIHLANAIDTMTKYELFDDVDLVVIPLIPGRSEEENALKTYAIMSKSVNRIMFAFSKFNPQVALEKQYKVFFDNLSDTQNVNTVLKNPEQADCTQLVESSYITVNDSDVFETAQHRKELVINLAAEIDYKAKAKAALSNGEKELYDVLMTQELDKRKARILVESCIMPAHKKIMLQGRSRE